MDSNQQNQFVAQILPDQRTMAKTAQERRMTGPDSHKSTIHVLFTLENLITLH